MTAAAPERALVLVVDDSDTARYAKLRILQRAGFDVIEANGGASALTLVAERNPRLVVLDVQMPDIDGWEVCRRIKAEPATASVLVLQTSATYVREADTVRALEGGADACLTEPVEPPVLVATVNALLRARRAEDALREALDRERVLRAAAEAANRAKDEFLATLSHELRSPLGAMLNWAVLLRGGGLDPEQTARALDAIERNTRLQTKLVTDLLDVSRIVSGKMVLDIGVVDLRDVVDAALDSVRAAADAKGIQIVAIVEPTAGPINGDASRLQQVVWNLLSNAVKFTPKGGRVELATRATDSQVEIRVTDTGRGIEAHFLPHIFEHFRQADSSSSRSEGGLGLGLAIVRHLVELHGGSVTADSDGIGRGTSFAVRLPLPAVSARSSVGSARRTAARSPDEGRLAGVRILLVDDESDAREALSAVLATAGAMPRPARSVAEAIAILEHDPIDVLVSDIAMPVDDGFELIRRIRESSRHAILPAIALTSYAAVNEQRDILAAGFDACLAKPVEPADLLAEIVHVTALRR